jgi:hypothetical protein
LFLAKSFRCFSPWLAGSIVFRLWWHRSWWRAYGGAKLLTSQKPENTERHRKEPETRFTSNDIPPTRFHMLTAQALWAHQ